MQKELWFLPHTSVGWLAAGGCQWEAQGASFVQGSDGELLPHVCCSWPCLHHTLLSYACLQHQAKKMAFFWGTPKVSSPNCNQSLSEVPRRSTRMLLEANGTKCYSPPYSIHPQISATAPEGLFDLWSPCLRVSKGKALQDKVEHIAKHPSIGEVPLSTHSNTRAISAPSCQTASWLCPSPRLLHVLGKCKMLSQHRSVKWEREQECIVW